MQPIRFRSEQSINGVKIKRLAYGGGGKNNPQRLVPYNDGFVLYIAAQCNFVYLHVLRESAILVSLRFDCPTLGASIVYAVNKLAQAKRTGTLAPIVPLALTMMPLEGLPKCYSACCSRPDLYARRFSHYGSGAGFGSPCLRRCEKEASSLSAACARSFTRESFSKSANGFAVSMRPSS